MDKLLATAAVVLGLLAASAAQAQCKPPLNSNEARLLAFYGAPVVFAPAGPPLPLGAGHIGIVGELETVPSAPRALNNTHICYLQSQESSHLAPVLPRLRLSVGLPLGFGIEGSYEPHIKVASATPDFGSLAVSYTRAVMGLLTIQARAHGTTGSVDGPVTCPASALQQSNRNAPCWGARPSNDRFSPNSLGADVTAAITPGRLIAYAGTGYVYMPERFRVGFTNLTGVPDRTLVEADLSRGTVFGGLGVRLVSRIWVGAQVYSVPADVTTFRASLSYHP